MCVIDIDVCICMRIIEDKFSITEVYSSNYCSSYPQWYKVVIQRTTVYTNTAVRLLVLQFRLLLVSNIILSEEAISAYGLNFVELIWTEKTVSQSSISSFSMEVKFVGDEQRQII